MCSGFAALMIVINHQKEVRPWVTIPAVQIFSAGPAEIRRPKSSMWTITSVSFQHIESVRRVDNRHSHWTAHLPIGMGTISWDAEIKQERPDERIVWASLPDADIQNAGCVIFKDAPGERGTEIKVNINYRPPAGPLGRAAAALANPAFSKIIRNDIRRFKALVETGEIPTTKGQPTGK